MKIRLDTLLYNEGYFSSREKARAAIMAGQVIVDGNRIDKPGTAVHPHVNINIIADTKKYVSRGGKKLEKAVAAFGLDFTGLIAIDIGASTGGFTDCLLQNGAHQVYAVDVGYGQLDWTLRSDPRVVVLERTNARYLTAQEIPCPVDVITIDVAFISLDKILPTVKTLLKPTGMVVALIKPQFEAGRDKVGKKGVVRDTNVHVEVIEKVISFAKSIGLHCHGLDFSPVKGPEGNIEYLSLFKLTSFGQLISDARSVVNMALGTLSE